MSTSQRRAFSYLGELLAKHTPEQLAELQAPKFGEAAHLPRFPFVSDAAVDRRWAATGAHAEARAELLDERTAEQSAAYDHNIENFVGTVKVPVGLAGPLRVNGLFAQGDYFVPLATTEAALVASYSRGAQLITAAGGASVALLAEGVTRAPGFEFESVNHAGAFVDWVLENLGPIRAAAEATTSHGKLIDVRVTMEGNHVYLGFDYFTGDASGQNMVTVATQAAVDLIVATSPVTPRFSIVEANLSGDKKATAISFTSVRGKKATAETTIPAELVHERLRATPSQMVECWRMAAIGSVLSGTIGAQGHFANGLAALYIACGQDAACVAESATGVTRMEVTPDGSLYASATLPNLMVGTVGGGTKLPSQKACLDIMGLSGEGHARALAEIAAALVLAGELSINGALVAGDFAKAHKLLARRRQAEGAK
jgi:hydroxymethylglutaryl-CoA reductase (NADPH)